MQEKESMASVVSVAVNFINNIKRIKEANFNFRKGSKQNFNFFSAIVSGKHSKDHHEKYHSNFIAYLLNPSASHDFESVFLKMFLEELRKKTESGKQEFSKIFPGFEENEKQLLHVSVEREKPVYGNIDIAIESKTNNWIIFIENKMEHYEAPNQVKDYCDWAENTNKDWIGVFLTKEGFPPPSVQANEYQNKVICLSYQDIIHWLILCCTNEKVIYYPHIISALMQYINIIKKNLEIMDNNEIIEIKDILNKNNKDSVLLSEYFPELKQALEEYTKDVRDTFLVELKIKLSERLCDEGITNNELGCDKFKIVISQKYPEYDEGGRGLWWGIYQPDGSIFKDLNSKFSLDKHYWESVKYQDINDDFDRETDKGSSIIIKSLSNITLREAILREITDRMVKETKKMAGLIQGR